MKRFNRRLFPQKIDRRPNGQPNSCQYQYPSKKRSTWQKLTPAQTEPGYRRQLQIRQPIWGEGLEIFSWSNAKSALSQAQLADCRTHGEFTLSCGPHRRTAAISTFEARTLRQTLPDFSARSAARRHAPHIQSLSRYRSGTLVRCPWLNRHQTKSCTAPRKAVSDHLLDQ